MATPQPIPALGSQQPFEAFYVPAFELKIGSGEETAQRVPDENDVRSDVLHDVEAVTYVDNVEEADSFSLTVNNWDARNRRLKYVGYPRRPTREPESTFASLFDLGKTFTLQLGYRGNLRPMMVGYVTNIDASFPQSGAPTLKVDAIDVLARRRERKFTWRWTNKTDSEIARELARAPGARGRPGLDFPIETSSQAAAREARHPRVAMRNQTVVSFLMERAKLHAYSVFRRRSGNRDALYFGPSELLRDVSYTLEWGKMLLEFRPTLKVAQQARSAVVRATNRDSGSRIRFKAELEDFALNEDLHAYLRTMGEDKEVVDRALRTQAEAKELAEATVRAALKGLVEVSGATVGLPDLRAGQIVDIRGVDYRFDGRYFLTQTTHTIDSGGYRTTFRARREQEGPVR